MYVEEKKCLGGGGGGGGGGAGCTYIVSNTNILHAY